MRAKFIKHKVVLMPFEKRYCVKGEIENGGPSYRVSFQVMPRFGITLVKEDLYDMKWVFSCKDVNPARSFRTIFDHEWIKFAEQNTTQIGDGFCEYATTEMLTELIKHERINHAEDGDEARFYEYCLDNLDESEDVYVRNVVGKCPHYMDIVDIVKRIIDERLAFIAYAFELIRKERK